MISSAREGVWLAHAGPRLLLQCEVKAQEVERPSSLPAIELLCDSKVFEVLVVGEDLNWMARPLKVVAPFLETSNYRQHFHVVDLIVAFDWTEHLGQERHWALLYTGPPIPGIPGRFLVGRKESGRFLADSWFNSCW